MPFMSMINVSMLLTGIVANIDSEQVIVFFFYLSQQISLVAEKSLSLFHSSFWILSPSHNKILTWPLTLWLCGAQLQWEIPGVKETEVAQQLEVTAHSSWPRYPFHWVEHILHPRLHLACLIKNGSTVNNLHNLFSFFLLEGLHH